MYKLLNYIHKIIFIYLLVQNYLTELYFTKRRDTLVSYTVSVVFFFSYRLDQ